MTNQNAIDYILSHCFDCEYMQEGECVTDNQCFEANRMAINALRERPKGKWQKPPRAKAYGRFCTVCHAKCWNVLRNEEYNYCPNCGAEMEGMVE